MCFDTNDDVVQLRLRVMSRQAAICPVRPWSKLSRLRLRLSFTHITCFNFQVTRERHRRPRGKFESAPKIAANPRQTNPVPSCICAARNGSGIRQSIPKTHSESDGGEDAEFVAIKVGPELISFTVLKRTWAQHNREGGREGRRERERERESCS